MSSKRLAIVAAGLFIACAFACGFSDFSYPLPNGFQLARTNAPSVTIFGPMGNGIAVSPKLVRMEVRGDFVFGEAVASPRADVPSVPGYFLLNTKTRSAQVGMGETAWQSALAQNGIEGAPRLKSISYYDTSQAAQMWRWISVALVALTALAMAACVIVAVQRAIARRQPRQG